MCMCMCICVCRDHMCVCMCVCVCVGALTWSVCVSQSSMSWAQRGNCKICGTGLESMTCSLQYKCKLGVCSIGNPCKKTTVRCPHPEESCLQLAEQARGVSIIFVVCTETCMVVLCPVAGPNAKKSTCKCPFGFVVTMWRAAASGLRDRASER